MRKTRKNRKQKRRVRRTQRKRRSVGGSEVVVVNGQTMSRHEFDQMMEQRDQQGSEAY